MWADSETRQWRRGASKKGKKTMPQRNPDEHRPGKRRKQRGEEEDKTF
jgi:hypothetical protein